MITRVPNRTNLCPPRATAFSGGLSNSGKGGDPGKGSPTCLPASRAKTFPPHSVGGSVPCFVVDGNDILSGALEKIPVVLFFFLILFASSAFALTPVEDSAEDLFWAAPMTVHDYKRATDLHNVAVSAMAFTELEFVRLGDGLVGLIARNKKSPIARSLDSLEYAYSRLPRIEPVRRFGQFWDALQLRQLSLSDARLVTSILFGDAVGGITPMMQVRVYKLVVFVEDVVYDLDKALLYPLNRLATAVVDRPVHMKLLSFVADGLGFLRCRLSAGLKILSREIVRAGSEAVFVLEKPQDAHIRRQRKKQNAEVKIYSKMPLSVFLEHEKFFRKKKNATVAGTVEDWRERIYPAVSDLPDDVRSKDLSFENLTPSDDSREMIVACRFTGWEEAPRELKKYVITSDELDELMTPRGAWVPAAL